MRSREDYGSFISVALGLTLIILIVFQLYISREPARIQAQEEADQQAAVAAGEILFAENCSACHGENGEGGVGPALNSRELLSMASDEVLFNLSRTGIPGTVMPAWGQSLGGPFTNEQIAQIVAYIRAWEPTAPQLDVAEQEPDPVRGAAIYSRTCFVCHGENGLGTEIAPALNNPDRLNRLEDVWYRNTISHGRPARGMPTWGTVLSPAQIDDVVALIGVWREGGIVTPEVSLAAYLSNALFAVREFDAADAEFYLMGARVKADQAQAEEIDEIIALVQENQMFIAQSRIATLLPPEEMGQALFTNNCAACHGADGTGATGPNLHNNLFIQSQTDQDLLAFILEGRRGTAMKGFDGVLAEEDLVNVVIFLRTWQP